MLNLINPGARVADYNIDRADTIDFDAWTIAQLPDDAMSEVVSSLDQLEATDRSTLVNHLCDRSDRTTTYGAIEYNRASVQADNVLDELCGTRRQVRTSNFSD